MGNTIYVLSMDMMLRAFDRNNGHQRWQKPASARVILPPHVLEGVVMVPGVTPTLSTFRADTGAAISTWTGPESSLLQGPPLIDEPKPLRVSIVTLFRDGRIDRPSADGDAVQGTGAEALLDASRTRIVPRALR